MMHPAPARTARSPVELPYAVAVSKSRRRYICRSCGSVELRWAGKCPSCGAWDSLEEAAVDAGAARDPQKGLAESFAAWTPEVEHRAESGESPRAVPIALAEADTHALHRISTGIRELDRVLGAAPAAAPAPARHAIDVAARPSASGLVPGSVVLLGGDPGIGKSTLVLQALARIAGEESARGPECRRALYVTSEESAEQVRLRAERLGIGPSPSLYVLADTNLARIVEQARQVRPAVLAIDSIQMIYKSDLDASPGSVAQLRRCCTELVYLAKLTGMAVMLVGHVTKDGQLAGPRLLEHLVDVVLSFEGDRYHAHRVVRAIKNRFGTTLEIGLFEMSDGGLREVPDAAGVAAGAWGDAPRCGSVVCPVVTGSRCVLIELQALTATGFPGAAKRKASGIDGNRLAMLIAVLEQHGGLRLYDRDVFASAVGGVRVSEPASDLALALAIAGSHHHSAMDPATAAAGEVGLGGEIRPVGHLDQRVREATRLGYRTLLVPPMPAQPAHASLKLVPVRTLQQALQHLTKVTRPRPSMSEA